MKRFIKNSTIVVISLLILLIIFRFFLPLDPGTKFLLSMAGFLNPFCYEKKEINMQIGDKNIPVLFYKTDNKNSDKYYLLIFGITPQGYNHPQINKLASSICEASGRNVFIPNINIKIDLKGRNLITAFGDITIIYSALREKYNGKYNAFGACIGGTALLTALNLFPRELYPEKIFLYGPFFRGKDLISYYNQSKTEVDFLVLLAAALNQNEYTNDEKKLITNAIKAIEPGLTDRIKMQKVLGNKLYKKINSKKLYHKEFQGINENSILDPTQKIPNSHFYILHSKNDHIIPYASGLGLHRYLLKCGATSKFIGTNIFSHTEKNISIKNLPHELSQLINFFNDLFAENK